MGRSCEDSVGTFEKYIEILHIMTSMGNKPKQTKKGQATWNRRGHFV